MPARSTVYYSTHPEARAHHSAKCQKRYKERYDNDEEFRNKVKAAASRRYQEKKEKARLAKLELE